MEHKSFFAQDLAGNVMAAALVTVRKSGTEILAKLYDLAGLEMPNPFHAGEDGKLSFSVMNGIYDIHVLEDGGVKAHELKRVRFFDATVVAASKDVLKDAMRSYQNGGAIPGEIWQGIPYSYRVAEPDDDAFHIETPGLARLYVNLNAFDLKAEAFDVAFTGKAEDAPRNAVQMQRALDWLAAQGQGGRIELASEGHMKIDSAIMCRNGIEIDGKGSITDNVRNRADPADASVYTQDNCYLMGAFARHDDDDHTFHPLAPIAAGDGAARLTDSFHLASYQVGDIVWIVEATEGTTFGSGGIMPGQSEIARIVAIKNGVFEFEHPVGITVAGAGAGTIGVDPVGAWIANVDFRVSAAKGGSAMMGTRHIARDIALVNHRLMQSGNNQTYGSAPFSARSGMYNGHVENIEALGPVSNLVFGNGYVRSYWKNIRGGYTRRAIELKFLSQNSIFEDIRAWKRNSGFPVDAEEDVPISIGERSRDIRLIRPWLDVGRFIDPAKTGGGNLIAFSGATDCRIEQPDIFGPSKYSSVVAFPESAVRCEVVGGRIEPPSNVSVEDYGTDCLVSGVRFGPADLYAYRRNGVARGGLLEHCRWPAGGSVKMLLDASASADDRALHIVGNYGLTSIENSAGRALWARDNVGTDEQLLSFAGATMDDFGGHSVLSTSEALIGAAVVVPAGVHSGRTRASWSVSGETLGLVGTKTLIWRVAVDVDDDGVPLDSDDDQNIAATVVLPANCAEWSLEASARFEGETLVYTDMKVFDLTNGTVFGDVRRHISVDHQSHPVRYELSGFVAEDGESLIVRTIEREFHREGFAV
ncbi:hypothetical protein [Pseudooceanicola sp. HF7]|uniref:hypothetical protein n=1 Tax=Pseudooceanicola sp. HF7 TaxID=2721560 RepID=UPI0014305905|nr:hypothetical protein [Pseudooceanicola sp. HF7]NIZ11090.1 hypothetical protein [Pseudooceanicola sp. HF7]